MKTEADLYPDATALEAAIADENSHRLRASLKQAGIRRFAVAGTSAKSKLPWPSPRVSSDKPAVWFGASKPQKSRTRNCNIATPKQGGSFSALHHRRSNARDVSQRQLRPCRSERPKELVFLDQRSHRQSPSSPISISGQTALGQVPRSATQIHFPPASIPEPSERSISQATKPLMLPQACPHA